MNLGQVVGTVVSTVKAEQFKGCKLLIVRPIDEQGRATAENAYVAVDAIGAGAGEVVLVAFGSAARHTGLTRDSATDAAIVAIVDILETNSEVTYRKS